MRRIFITVFTCFIYHYKTKTAQLKPINTSNCHISVPDNNKPCYVCINNGAKKNCGTMACDIIFKQRGCIELEKCLENLKCKSNSTIMLFYGPQIIIFFLAAVWCITEKCLKGREVQHRALFNHTEDGGSEHTESDEQYLDIPTLPEYQEIKENPTLFKEVMIRPPDYVAHDPLNQILIDGI